MKNPDDVSSPPMKYFGKVLKNFLLKFLVKFTIVNAPSINEEPENDTSSHYNRPPE